MRYEQETELVEAYACDRVDTGCVNSASGLELFLRFHPVGAIKDIAFAIPVEDAEEVALKILAKVKDIAQIANLN